MCTQKQHLFTLFLLLFCSTISWAQPRPGNEVIDYQTHITVDRGKLITEHAYLIQINNKESDWISDIAIPYSGESLEILEAAILDTNGNTLRTLRKKEIETRSAIDQGSFYEDSYVKEFKLKWNTYPYRIKYRYRQVAHQFLHVAEWYPVLRTNVPTQKASLTVQLPLNYRVKLEFPEVFKHTAATLSAEQTLRWEIADIGPFEQQAFGLPLEELIPHVSIVPEVFTYGLAGSFSSWASFGNWLNQMNEGLDLLPVQEQLVVHRLTEGVKDKKEIVKILYHHLQDHTRYINVSIDLGGLKPYPAAYVCTNKYGDCKALTIYMKALLRQVGIDSYYTTIYADDNPVQIKTHLPSQQFNHVILCVPVDGDTLWLENTTNNLPFNYQGTFIQNREALLVSNNSRLVKTPALQLEDVLEKSTYHYELHEDGAGVLQITQELRGNAFEYYRYLQHNRSEKELLQAIEAGIAVKNYELSNWKASQPHRDAPLLNLELSLKLTNQLRKLGSSLVISPSPLALPKLPFTDSRKEQIRISYPLNKLDSISYQLRTAEQYLVKMPQDVVIASEYGRYQEQYQQSAGRISITRSFQLFAGDYPEEEFPAFYAFLTAVRDTQKKSAIVLNPR